ncbi:hypothetical protein KIPB_015744, partial [Kipferlia bialata]|eukprot:g15744.t1
MVLVLDNTLTDTLAQIQREHKQAVMALKSFRLQYPPSAQKSVDAGNAVIARLDRLIADRYGICGY